MTKLYYNLIDTPKTLNDDFKLPTNIPPNFSYFLYDTSVLTDDIIYWYKFNLNLDISFVALFYRQPREDNLYRQNQGWIHSDLTWSPTGWKHMYYGVNFEVTPYPTKLSWWKTSEQEIYPSHPSVKTMADNLRGIHYGKRVNFDPLDDNYTLLDSLIVTDKPTLVNVNIPHSADYAGHSVTRIGISLRFSKEVDSWEQAIDLFKNVIE